MPLSPPFRASKAGGYTRIYILGMSEIEIARAEGVSKSRISENIKRGLAALFNFLQENGVSSMKELYTKVTAMQTEYYGLRREIAATDRQISGLKKHLSMWKQYADNKPFHQRLSALKPRAQAAYQDEHYIELALYGAAVQYLNGLKDRGEKLTPKAWQAEAERLTAHNNAFYQRMKAMRPDVQAVEKIRQTADRLARLEKSRDRGQGYDR